MNSKCSCLASLSILCYISSWWFVLIVLWFSIILIHYSIFIRSAGDGCLGCVHCRPVNSIDAINICVCFDEECWVKLLSHMVCLSSALMFSKVVAPDCLPTSTVWVF